MRIQVSIILFLLCCVCSCTDKLIFLPGTGEDEETYTVGQIEIFLENPEAMTRSEWVYDGYFPENSILSPDTKIERWLHNLWLVSFDSNFLLEYFVKDQDYSTDSQIAINTLENENNTNKAFSVFTLGAGKMPVVTTGAHYFYILSNLHPQDMETLANFLEDKIGIMTKDEFEKLTTFPYYSRTIEEITQIYSTVDAQGVPTYKPSCMMTNVVSPPPHYMADKSLIIGNASYPDVNGISMTIGKSFAKVSVAIPEGTCETLSDVQYRIINDPQQMYMLPNIFNEQVHTPHYDIDPGNDFQTYFETYFNIKSGILYEFEEDEIGEYDNTNNNNTAPLYKSNFTWRDVNTSTTAIQKTYAYCMENGNKTTLQGNSTMVLIKAKYTPETWLNTDGTSGSPSAPGLNGTFWRIKNASGTYKPGYYNEEPIATGSQTVEKYENGITYYPIWIETDGKYMVERNHYYKFAITQVLSPGAPDLNSVMNPEMPLPNTKTRSITSGNNFPDAATAIRWIQND